MHTNNELTLLGGTGWLELTHIDCDILFIFYLYLLIVIKFKA